MADELTNHFGSLNTGLDQLYNTAILNTDFKTKTSTIQDTSSVSDATGDIPTKVYTAPPGRPQLDKTTVTISTAGFQTIHDILKNYPADVLAATGNLPPVPDDKFPDEMEAEIDALGESKLAEIGNGDPAKGKQILRHAILHNNANLPPELKKLADGILEKATLKAGNGPNKTFVKLEEQAIGTQNDLNFQGSIILAKLSDKEQAQIYFAYFIPEAADTLPPNLQKLLKEAKAEAFASVQKDYGLPNNWQPTPDREGFLKQMGSDFSTSVEGKITALGLKNGLSRGQINELKTIFFTGSSDTPNAKTLKPLLNEMIKEAKAKTQTEFGFPDGFAPPVDSKDYNAVLNGTFSDDFNNIVDAKLKDLSSEDKSLIKNALTSKEAQAALPPQLKDSFNKVQQAAITRLGQTHGVSPNWVPDTELLALAAVKMKTINLKLALEQINQGKEWANSGIKTLKDLNKQIKDAGGTPPPSHNYIMNYLNSVAMVLIRMKEMSYVIAMTDSNLAMTMNKIQNDDEIGNLKKQEKDLKEVMAKEKKAESMGPLKAIFTWILNLILVMFLGPLAFVVIAAMMAKSIIEAVKEGKDGFKALMAFDVISEVTKTFEQIGKAIGGPFGNFLAKAMSVMAIVALAVVCPMAVAADLLMGDGTIVKELCKAVGIPKDVAEKLTMAAQIVAQVVAMVVMAVLTAGASIAVSIAQITKTIAQIALTIIKTVISLATNFVKTITQMATVIVAKAIEILVDAGKQIVNALKAVGANSSKLGKFQQALSKAEHFVKSAQAELNHTIAGVDKGSRAEIYLQKVIDNSNKTIAKLTKDTAKQVAINEASQNLNGLKAEQTAAQEAFDNAPASAKEATKVTLDKAKAARENADSLIKTAAKKEMKDAETLSVNRMQTISSTVQTVKDVADAVVSIHNNILQAQIIRMKAAIEAAKILVEMFVKIMKEMVAKLMQMAKGATGDAKEIGDQVQRMFAEASNVIENLCSTRA